MKSKASLALFAIISFSSGSVTLRAGDPALVTPAKKTATPLRPPTESAVTDAQRDLNRWNYQPVTYVNVRVASLRARAPWSPGAPGD